MIRKLTLLSLLLVFSCKGKEEKTSEVKFVASEQDKRNDAYYKDGGAFYQTLSKWFLIHKVHDKITFELQISGTCTALEPAAAFTKKALTEWLNVLSTAITGNQLTPKTKTGITESVQRVDASGDLNVHFHCENGVSILYPHADKISDLHIYGFSEEVRQHFAEGTEFLDEIFPYSVVLHELGHAFGLGDTYILNAESQKAQDKDVQAINQSTNDIEITFGSQPPSIMNLFHLFTTLQPDDHDGMIWLYKYYVSNEVSSLQTCPPGYLYEKATGGCLLDQESENTPSSGETKSLLPPPTENPSTNTLTATIQQLLEKMTTVLQHLDPVSMAASIYKQCLTLQAEGVKNFCYEHAFVIAIVEILGQNEQTSPLLEQIPGKSFYRLTPAGKLYIQNDLP